jgi:hypothetical protein
MIDEIRIKGLEEWPGEAIVDLKALVQRESDLPVWDNQQEIGVELPDEWPNLKRENLKRGIAKSLDKFERDHGYYARIETIEYVEHTEVDFE